MAKKTQATTTRQTPKKTQAQIRREIDQVLSRAPGAPVVHRAPPMPSASTGGHGVTPAMLLSAVHDALPRIGPEGRFGDEKVFVSALWQRIEADPRMRGLTIDQFKRWLVSANRDGDLQLARADLVGAMNPRLVADSEINSMGSTFHFVLDRTARLSY